MAEFPAVAKAALADDLADDSFGERLLGKLRGLVSLRRVGNDVEGDGTEAKLARAEAALDAGDVAKAVALVKTLPPQTSQGHRRLAVARRGPSRGQAGGRPDLGAGRHPARRGAVGPAMTMLRTIIWFVFAIVAMLGAVWLAERPGTVTAEFRGWRLDTSVGVLMISVLVLILVSIGGWLLYRWIVGAPGALLDGWGESRRRRGYRELTQGSPPSPRAMASRRRSMPARPSSSCPSRRSRSCCRRRPPSSTATATARGAPSTPCSRTSRWPSSACAA